MPEELFSIKGTNDGLLVSLSTTEKWQSVTDALAKRIDDKRAFFTGAKIIVELGARPVPKYELSSLKALLERRGLSLSLVRSDSDTTRQSARSLDIRTSRNSGRAASARKPSLGKPADADATGSRGVIFRRTLRSGRTIHSEGHVVVFGDVNAGAKVVAAGDIVIWGKLRGTVHAGALGDESAVVCALDMNPNQLRIASYIVTSPPGKRSDILPEVASIRDNQIVVESRD
ncbi:MAG: septum site-determining protein MinC [Chloroflexi bacterium]|nr:septum site-determining protein MinC [Chloroflexota bacterium]MCY3582083.1 septum site-determining protein MinC [Chloroflexota bacterium]MCY3715880.1 septum site-determining protein MinC [Chloroflexota bacterium]MDE2649509.1 septum site-determining protein MinC [Chloroflexota bacterium]MXV93334.1 septum site-determining protein MinC [Chloroflexota bacterium]